MLQRTLLLFLILRMAVPAADLPIREVILYKHGVGFFERSGELKAGDTARLDFKAGDMNDVLKSLTLTDRNGGKIDGVRYDASEPVEKRLENFPFAAGQDSSMAALLDQMKGSRLELKLGSEVVSGTIVSARLIRSSGADKGSEREMVVLLMDSGEIRTFDLDAATSVKFSEPKLQALLKDYLGVLSQANSKDLRSVYINSAGSAARELVASYMTPAAVWKSSYRLLFGDQGEPTLEGWAIVDNTSGDDWTNVRLSVVSGKPISFITQLYEPRYVQRPGEELAENRAVGPVVYQGAMELQAADRQVAAASPAARRDNFLANGPMAGGGGGGRGGAVGRGVADGSLLLKAKGDVDGISQSSLAATADGREEGDLFEYNFASPVTIKKGESAMLPFLQQKIGARRLLIYSENYGLHPMDAAEITNSIGKTLDGGPITVYDAGRYAGEALVETVKAGDKRLISYGVDLGTRISTVWDSSKEMVREVHFHRGVLTTKSAVDETKTYTINNVDAKAKTVVIEHAQRAGYKLLDQKPVETTSNAYRFEVKVGPTATEKFAVHEERVYDQGTAITNMTPDVLAGWVQNKALSDAGRNQLQQIVEKKRQIAGNDTAIQAADASLRALTEDQQRFRSNIDSLRNVSGQQDLVQQYARQLATGETKIAALRDSQSELRRTKTALDAELNALIEKAEF